MNKIELYEGLLSRRSIRKYSGKEIDIQTIKDILKAGMYCPTAMNEQPWHFVVFNEKENLNQLSEFIPHGKMLPDAAAAILVCWDKNLQKTEGYEQQDCAVATQNILLAAHSKGIGSVWLGIYPRQDRIKNITDFLDLPENITPFSLISLGYPAEEKQFPQRFNESKIHFNKW